MLRNEVFELRVELEVGVVAKVAGVNLGDFHCALLVGCGFVVSECSDVVFLFSFRVSECYDVVFLFSFRVSECSAVMFLLSFRVSECSVCVFLFSFRVSECSAEVFFAGFEVSQCWGLGTLNTPDIFHELGVPQKLKKIAVGEGWQTAEFPSALGTSEPRCPRLKDLPDSIFGASGRGLGARLVWRCIFIKYHASFFS